MNTLKDIIHYVIGKADWMKTMIGIGAMTLYFMVIRALITVTIPPENKESIIHALGSLDGIFAMIVGYYFGSSKGSQDKSETIKKHITDQKE